LANAVAVKIKYSAFVGNFFYIIAYHLVIDRIQDFVLWKPLTALSNTPYMTS